MKKRMACVAFLVAATVTAAGEAELRRELARCAALDDDAVRLTCYDGIGAHGAGRPAARSGWHEEAVTDAHGPVVRWSVEGDEELVGREVRARGRLVIECSGRELSAHVFTGMAAHAEHRRDDHTVLLRFDDDERFTVRMAPAMDDEGLVIPWPVMTVNRFLEHDRLYFQFNPQGSRPAKTTFTLTGLRDLVTPKLDACGLIALDDGSLEAIEGE